MLIYSCKVWDTFEVSHTLQHLRGVPHLALALIQFLNPAATGNMALHLGAAFIAYIATTRYLHVQFYAAIYFGIARAYNFHGCFFRFQVKRFYIAAAHYFTTEVFGIAFQVQVTTAA